MESLMEDAVQRRRALLLLERMIASTSSQEEHQAHHEEGPLASSSSANNTSTIVTATGADHSSSLVSPFLTRSGASTITTSSPLNDRWHDDAGGRVADLSASFVDRYQRQQTRSLLSSQQQIAAGIVAAPPPVMRTTEEDNSRQNHDVDHDTNTTTTTSSSMIGGSAACPPRGSIVDEEEGGEEQGVSFSSGGAASMLVGGDGTAYYYPRPDVDRDGGVATRTPHLRTATDLRDIVTAEDELARLQSLSVVMNRLKNNKIEALEQQQQEARLSNTRSRSILRRKILLHYQSKIQKLLHKQQQEEEELLLLASAPAARMTRPNTSRLPSAYPYYYPEQAAVALSQQLQGEHQFLSSANREEVQQAVPPPLENTVFHQQHDLSVLNKKKRKRQLQLQRDSIVTGGAASSSGTLLPSSPSSPSSSFSFSITKHLVESLADQLQRRRQQSAGNKKKPQSSKALSAPPSSTHCHAASPSSSSRRRIATKQEDSPNQNKSSSIITCVPSITDHATIGDNEQQEAPPTTTLTTLRGENQEEEEKHFSSKEEEELTRVLLCGGNKKKQENRWTMRLDLPDDHILLSPFTCFLRSTCIEIYKATEDDIMYRNRSKSVALNQIGLRCSFCCLTKSHHHRGKRSSTFPSSVSKIYQNVSVMVREHFPCKEMPVEIHDKFMKLRNEKIKGGMDSKAYWNFSALKIGMKDKNGAIFMKDPEDDTDENIDPALTPTYKRVYDALGVDTTTPATITPPTNSTVVGSIEKAISLRHKVSRNKNSKKNNKEDKKDHDNNTNFSSDTSIRTADTSALNRLSSSVLVKVTTTTPTSCLLTPHLPAE